MIGNRTLKSTVIYFSLICLGLLYTSNLSALSKPNSDQLNPKIKMNAYSVPKDKWIDFTISDMSKLLHIVTNGEYVLSYEKFLSYTIDVNILDNKEKVLFSKKYNPKFKDEVLRQAKTKRMMSNPYLINLNRYLSKGFNIDIPQKKLSDAVKLRIKWSSKYNVVTGLTLRVTGAINPKDITGKNIAPNNKNDYTEVLIGKLPINEVDNKHFKLRHPKKRDRSKVKPMYELYLNSGVDGVYEKPSKIEQEQTGKLFIKLFKGADVKDVKQECDKVNMGVQEFNRGKNSFIVIYEKKGHKTGRGFYIFCRGPETRNLVIDAPHRFYDKKTGLIAYELMLSGDFTACAWNSVNRYQTPSHVDGSSDMAHTSESIFFSFTNAFAEAMPDKSVLMQFHGFRSEWKNKKGKVYFSVPYDFVLSSGTKTPGKVFLSFAEKIKKESKRKIAVIPEQDIPQLAATTNPEVKVLKEAGKGQVFIHMEMSGKARTELKKSTGWKKALIDNLRHISVKYDPQKNYN